VLEGEQVPQGPAPQLLLAEDLAQQLQQAPDRLVVPLHAAGAHPQAGGDLHQQVHVAREHGIDLQEVQLGDGLARVSVQLQVGAVLLEQSVEIGFAGLLLAQQPPVHHVADVGGRQVHAQARREAVLQLGQVAALQVLVQLLLARGQKPDPALQSLPQGLGQALQGQLARVALEDVLADLVHHEEERPPPRPEAEHGLHVPDGLVHRGPAAGAAAHARVHPGGGLGVQGRVEAVHDLREVVLGQEVVHGLGPGATQGLVGAGQELFPPAVALQLQLVVGHEVRGGAVAQPLLELAPGRQVDVLVLSGNRPDVEDHGQGIDLLEQTLPGFAQLLVERRAVPGQQGLGQPGAAGQDHAVQGQAQELGEAGLTRAEEPGDPAVGKLGAALALQFGPDGAQQVLHLLVDAVRHAGVARVFLGVAAGDDVLPDLLLHPLGVLLVEVDHGRDVSGDVRLEDLLDQHGATPWRDSVSIE